MTETLTYGSLDEAETAYLMNAYDRVLDGWEYLGSGIHRSAYLSPSKVVYKVAHDGYRSRQAQYAEALAVEVLSKEVPPAGFGVPKADIVEVIPGLPVIAMEYIDGDGAYLDGPQYTEACRFYRNSDIHAGNMMVRPSDGTIFMIDLGFFAEDFDAAEYDNPECTCCRPCAYCGEAGCEAACQFCNNCGERECVCCDVCYRPRDDRCAWDVCDCCVECGDVPDNCCCDFCEVCTQHKDDCRGGDACVSPFL